MKYMLDTNICIYLIKRKPVGVLERFRSLSLGDIGVSSITVVEMFYGIHKSSSPVQNKVALEQFLAPLEIADFDARAAEHCGQVRAYLESKGTPIGAYDLLIASHACSMGATLVTNNVSEFSSVPGISLENWVEG